MYSIFEITSLSIKLQVTPGPDLTSKLSCEQSYHVIRLAQLGMQHTFMAAQCNEGDLLLACSAFCGAPHQGAVSVAVQ